MHLLCENSKVVEAAALVALGASEDRNVNPVHDAEAACAGLPRALSEDGLVFRVI